MKLELRLDWLILTVELFPQTVSLTGYSPAWRRTLRRCRPEVRRAVKSARARSNSGGEW